MLTVLLVYAAPRGAMTVACSVLCPHTSIGGGPLAKAESWSFSDTMNLIYLKACLSFEGL